MPSVEFVIIGALVIGLLAVMLPVHLLDNRRARRRRHGPRADGGPVIWDGPDNSGMGGTYDPGSGGGGDGGGGG
ncbi:hypothetical protein GCM10010466_14250 [Planomonospora alba]|uniref:Uncharacterized protein n=1 Tax=Planomonospora alba TaxID=161354 RepID=A0ABP6MSH3_9ACTN